MQPSLDDAVTSLALASSRLHPDDIPKVVAAEASKLGVSELVIYLSDLDQRLLVPLPPQAEALEPLAIDGTTGGRAYRTERLIVVADGAESASAEGRQKTVWLPLMDSAERIGVISAALSGEPDGVLLAKLLAISNLAAELIANKAVYGDVITRCRRSHEMTLAAEMRWSLLPPLTFTGRNLTISGIVEPAYEIAGDTFDYAVNGDTAHLAIIDAVGHGLEAARIANLAVGAYRHSRRRDLGLVETYRVMDEILNDQFGLEKFATAQLAALALSSGHLSWINAGHPPPMLIRNGHRIDMASESCLPIGLAAAHGGSDPEVTVTHLDRGDTVLFFTDGVSEARSVNGEMFGRDRLGDLLLQAMSAGQALAETMRLLGHAVLTHQLGVLQDDATLLLLAWHGPPTADVAPPD